MLKQLLQQTNTDPARSLRIKSSVVLLACGGILAIAAYLSPDPRGFGTHEQLGLPPCVSRFFVGFPCPMCGMTTSFALMADARPDEAFHAQPAGVVLFLLLVLVAAGAGVTLISGKMPEHVTRFTPATHLLMPGTALILFSWLYKLFFA